MALIYTSAIHQKVQITLYHFNNYVSIKSGPCVSCQPSMVNQLVP